MNAFKEPQENVTWDCLGPCKCQECTCVHYWHSVPEFSAMLLNPLFTASLCIQCRQREAVNLKCRAGVISINSDGNQTSLNKHFPIVATPLQ